LNYIRSKQQEQQQQKKLALDSTDSNIDNSSNDGELTAIGKQTVF
jgi:hypothetical protein